MDLEQQELAEDIEQIELLLNSTTTSNNIPPQHRRYPPQQQIEEVDSDEEEELQISAAQGLFSTSDAVNANQDDSSREYGEEEYQDEEESDEELGDTLETALKLNMAYQELLRMQMDNIKELLNRNAEHQRKGEQQIVMELNRPRRHKENDLFRYPYFKDDFGTGPPKNVDAKMRDQLFPVIELPKLWKVFQEEILVDCLEEQMKFKCLKDLHLRLKKCRQGVVDADQGIESETDLLYTIDAVKSSFSLADVPVEDVVSNADWLNIANHHLEGAFNTESCIAMYRNVCNPLINRSQWTPAEEETLKELVAKHGHQSWELVAQELGSDRSPFLCLQRYQQVLNDYETTTWTEEKEEIMYQYLVTNMGTEDTVAWEKVAWMVGDMTPLECKKRWELLKNGSKRKWSRQEDLALVEAMSIHKNVLHSARPWMLIAAHVKTRNSMQCRERWTHRLQPDLIFSSWSLEDDEILVSYLRAFNQAKLAHPDVQCRYDIQSLKRIHFPKRVGNSITQRLRTLQQKIEKGTIDKHFAYVKTKKEKLKNLNKKRFAKVMKVDDSAEFDEELEVEVRRSSRPRKVKVEETSYIVQPKHDPPNWRVEQLDPSVMSAMDVENSLKILLAGYPQCAFGSATVSALESCVRAMVQDPSVSISADTVRNAVEKNRLRWSTFYKAKDKDTKAYMMRCVAQTASKDYTPVKGPVRMVNANKSRSTSHEVESVIKKILNCRQSVTLPQHVQESYAQLIRKSMLGEAELMAFRQSSSTRSGNPVKLDLPFFLPPNQITLSAVYRLMAVKQKLVHMARGERREDAENVRLMELKESAQFKTLRERMTSMFFWPACLRKCDPNAVIFQAMTNRKYRLHKTTSSNKVAGSAATPVLMTTSAHTNGRPANGSGDGTSSQVAAEVATSSQQQRSATTTVMEVASPTQVKAQTKSGRKLPNDVTAIILKALQEKDGKQVALCKPVNNVLRPVGTEPYETIILKLDEQSDGAVKENNRTSVATRRKRAANKKRKYVHSYDKYNSYRVGNTEFNTGASNRTLGLLASKLKAGVASSPQTTPQDSQHTEKHDGQLTGERHGDQLIGEHHGNQLIGERHGDQLIGERHGNQLIGEHHGNQLIGEHHGNQLIGERHGNQLVGKKPNEQMAIEQDSWRLAEHERAAEVPPSYTMDNDYMQSIRQQYIDMAAPVNRTAEVQTSHVVAGAVEPLPPITTFNLETPSVRLRISPRKQNFPRKTTSASKRTSPSKKISPSTKTSPSKKISPSKKTSSKNPPLESQLATRVSPARVKDVLKQIQLRKSPHKFPAAAKTTETLDQVNPNTSLVGKRRLDLSVDDTEATGSTPIQATAATTGVVESDKSSASLADVEKKEATVGDALKEGTHVSNSKVEVFRKKRNSKTPTAASIKIGSNVPGLTAEVGKQSADQKKLVPLPKNLRKRRKSVSTVEADIDSGEELIDDSDQDSDYSPELKARSKKARR